MVNHSFTPQSFLGSKLSQMSKAEREVLAGQRLLAPAAERNKAPILEILKQHLPTTGKILEIACGTGQHASFFSQHFSKTSWQPSDREDSSFQSVHAWGVLEGGEGWQEPIILDVTQDDWGIEKVDAIVCLNMIHISPWETCEGLMRGAAKYLSPDGLLFLYGPYRVDGVVTAPSNEQFDRSLRNRDPRWGLRVLGDVEKCAKQHGLCLNKTVEMPANNLSLCFSF